MSLDNHSYNLIKAAIKRSESIWKMDQYLKDAAMCRECTGLWGRLKDVDKQILDEIRKVLESHAQTGMLK